LNPTTNFQHFFIMNSELPNPPEDRLLDELLREQARGPDEAFLQQIEQAIDAGPTTTRAGRSYVSLAVAAALTLVTGLGIWWRTFDHRSFPQTVTKTEEMHQESKMHSERSEIVDGGIKKNSLALMPQQTKPMDSEGARVSPALPEAEPISELTTDNMNSLSNTTLAANGPNQGIGGGGGLEGAGAGSGFGRGSGMGSGKLFGLVPQDGDAAPAKARTRNHDTAGFIPPAESRTGDRYGSFIDQPWKSPDRDQLSTFSIDVDTASYANVRRMIREGREIPKDAVRIEEFINAFKYQYEAPKGDGPFAVGATLAVCPWNPDHQLVRVSIKGREIEPGKRPASNLVFLIDVSGSMQSPDKLPLLKQSMETLVSQLDERDRVAIVVYAGSEGVALPSTRLDSAGRSKVLTAIANLDAGGSTNGGAGIKRAYELAMEQQIAGGVNRVILATDGDFNVGVTGQESLVKLVKDRAKSGVYLTVAGFGTGNLNDAMMDAITRDGNGNYFYIDSEREGRKVFLQNLAGTLVTIAKDVKIQVEFNPAKVGSYRLIGYSNRVLRNEDFSNDKVDAGDIGAGHTVTAFYELTPPGATPVGNGLKYQTVEKPATTNDWLTVKLRHKHPEGDESSLIEFPLTGSPSAVDLTDRDFQFATAAALLGMKLRGMDEVREIGWNQVIALAKPGLADDVTEDRAEFVELVKILRDRNSQGRPRVVPPPAGKAEVIPAAQER
jgi:Ca-activated chloride channel family protein